jgi:hypothetical protein
MKKMRFIALLLLVGLCLNATAESPPSAPTSTEKTPSKVPVEAPKKTVDRMDLDATEVTGTKELPKVMVIVPWKHNQAGEVAGRPSRSLMDEVLQPIDREVVRRELAYFQKLPRETEPSKVQPEN